MQLARFRLFVREVNSSREILDNVKRLAIYRRCEGFWLDETDSAIADNNAARSLSEAFAVSGPSREPNSHQTFFPVPDLKVVVVTSTAVPTRAATRMKLAQAIQASLQHANDAFDATHDGLTGLLNAKTIDQELFNAVERAKTYAPPLPDRLSLRSAPL